MMQSTASEVTRGVQKATRQELRDLWFALLKRVQHDLDTLSARCARCELRDKEGKLIPANKQGLAMLEQAIELQNLLKKIKQEIKTRFPFRKKFDGVAVRNDKTIGVANVAVFNPAGYRSVPVSSPRVPSALYHGHRG